MPDALNAILSLTLATSILAGCANQLQTYEQLTAKTTAEFNKKLEQYARDSKQFDSVRAESQSAREAQTASENLAYKMQLDLLGITDPKRQELITSFQAASDNVLLLRQQQSSPLPVPELTPPKEIADVIKALDELSREASRSEQLTFIFDYFKEVYDDLNKDKQTKTAEKTISKSGSPGK